MNCQRRSAHLAILAAVIAILPGAAAGPALWTDSGSESLLVVEVYYNALVANEYVVVFNPTDAEIALANWTLTDLEGTLAFPPNTLVGTGQKVVIAQNSSLYRRDTLETADFHYAGGDAPAMLARGGLFALNNQGDEVLLRNPQGDVVDAFVYGDSSYSGLGWSGPPAKALAKGRVAQRADSEGIFQDTDSSADWDCIRARVIGQSTHPLTVFEFDGVAQGIISPDSASDTLAGIIDSAEDSIFLNVYEFTDLTLGERILAAVNRGVDVRILAEGAPVGGMEEAELSILRGLSNGGAAVRLLRDNSSLGVKARYRYDHAKYVVVDNRTLVVGSENWVRNGFPPDGVTGNRGWSVRIDNPGLSTFMAGVFLEDWNPARMDSVDIARIFISPVRDGGESDGGFAREFAQQPFAGHFRVTPVIGPDNSLDVQAVIGLIESARSSLSIEQFYVSKSWGTSPNLFLEEAVNAARRGVDVRILLDSSWYNVDANETMDNDDTVAYVNEVAARERIPIAAKLGNSTSHDLVKFHNKGIVVDGEKVLVSSINWNLNSVTENRELGLIVENRELASFLDAAFAYDWKDDVTPPFADAGEDFTVQEGKEVYFSGISSRDDVGIEEYRWDIGGDGNYELNASVVSWRFLTPGEYIVILRVADAWGNAAQDRVNVTVIRAGPPPAPEGPSMQWVLATICVLAAVFIIFAIVFRRRKR
jgi:phosphatidylserine/phosphatidylglycerophosphate/cardiolipin synthase-like enzyme